MPFNDSSCNHKKRTSQGNILRTDEITQIDALRNAILKDKLISPPEHVWERIVVTQAAKPSMISSIFSWRKSFIKLAASVCVVSISWLLWNNHALKTELDEVLQVNRLLEGQLMKTNMPTFQQTQLLSEIRIIELALSEAMTTKEKIVLLKKREKLMQTMVYKKQGQRYEYSI